ncbi:family 16 glycosylhydrolase [Rhodobacteraceae bacterium NNCM2]|nr:family 16 glycosylhydrolase [Coraliihabitans acroporae]
MANQTVRAAAISLSILAGIGASATASSETGNGFIVQFGETGLEGWYQSNFSIKDEGFITGWRRKMIEAPTPGKPFMTLTIAPSTPSQEKPFIGSEVQRAGPYHYGRYEVVMRAAKGSGLVSSFFTYTGPYFGDPHDEIDFEFLGRDTTKVWLNRFVAGEKLPGQWLDLGFDAAEKPHLYAFDWSAEGITWYADGHELLDIDASETAIPTTPQKLFMNIWAGNESQAPWTGETAKDASGAADYYCVSFRPAGDDGPQCSDTFALSD